MPKYKLLFFQKEDGTAPAEDYINLLDNKMAAKVYRLLMMISKNGPELREPYSKHLEDGVFELRTQIGSDLSRVLYFFANRRRVILTNGFSKKTQKTPRSEIEKAKAYRKEYYEREAHNDENT